VTAPDYSGVVDTSRPRPVRIAMFAGFVLQALLAVFAAAFAMAPTLVGSLLGVVALVQVAGWLFVEQKVTPLANPAVQTTDGTLVALTPDAPPPPPSSASFDSMD
jgi:hypothetical protein